MSLRHAILAGLLCASAVAQPAAEPSVEEQQSLMAALADGQTSGLDMIRALEAHVARFPKTTQIREIEQTLAKAALDAGDMDRLVRYGEPLIEVLPDDMLLLDRLAFALVNQGDAALAARGYKHARALEDLLNRIRVVPGNGAWRKQDDWDREMARALLYQSRARNMEGHADEAAQLAKRAFAALPSEEAARERAEILRRTGRNEEAIEQLAEAFAVADPGSSEAARQSNRKLLGEWYTALHGSEKGMGDVILAAYDRVSALTETRRAKLQALEPNAALQDAMEFTLAGLDGKPLRLGSLKGKIVVLDFWASWCVPCRTQHPLYETLKQRFPESSGVVFLAVNADEDRSVVEPFLTEQMWDKRVYFEDGLARLLNVTNIPSTILFDRSGKLASRMDGFDPSTFLDLMTARLEGLVAAK